MAATMTIVREYEVDLVVDSMEDVAEDVVALTLRAADRRELPRWTPGAHIDLILNDDLTRQYSLCGDPLNQSAWRIAVLKEPNGRGGSTVVHDLAEGSTVRVRGPRNHFPLTSSPRYLFIAGGIGITPLVPMIAEAAAAKADWRLIYGGRQLSSMAFVEELSDYGDRVQIVHEDTMGFPDLAGELGTPQPNTLIYCCGPEGLLSAVESLSATWPPGSLQLERFSAKPPDTAGEDASFELVLERSGLTLTVPPDQSVYEVVKRAGVSVLASCLEGVCGTCETEVIDGEVDHRDSVLNDEEKASNEFMMICVSRCRSARLTLDL